MYFLLYTLYVNDLNKLIGCQLWSGLEERLFPRGVQVHLSENTDVAQVAVGNSTPPGRPHPQTGGRNQVIPLNQSSSMNQAYRTIVTSSYFPPHISPVFHKKPMVATLLPRSPNSRVVIVLKCTRVFRAISL